MLPGTKGSWQNAEEHFHNELVRIRLMRNIQEVGVMPGRSETGGIWHVGAPSYISRAHTQLQDWNLLHWGKTTIRGAISIKNVKDYSSKLILELLLYICGIDFKRQIILRGRLYLQN